METSHVPRAAGALAIRPTPTALRFVVLAWLCGAAVLSYASRNSIGVAESTIRQDLNLSKKQSGWMMSAFFVSYAVCQIPGAWFGQRFGARRALPCFAVGWSLATAATAVGGLWMLSAARFLKGAAQAGLFPVCTGVIAQWFPKNRRTVAIGMLASAMSVGGAAGAALAGWLVAEFGWRWMFVFYSLPGLIWAVLFWKWFRNAPHEHSGVNLSERQLIEADRVDEPPAADSGASAAVSAVAPAQTAAARPKIPWPQLLTSPAMWCIGGQQFFRAAGYMFFTSWFATYLQESRGVTIVTSGLLSTWPLLCVVIGSLAGGVVSDAVLQRTGSRRLARQFVAAASLALCAVFTWIGALFADAHAAVLIISLGSFFAALAGPCGYTITIDMGGQHVPTVNSVMNMCGNFGAMLLPLVVPWLLQATGSWNAVLFGFGGLYVAAALCWCCLKPEGTVFAQGWPRHDANPVRP